MVVCLSYEFSPNMISIQEGYKKNFHIRALNIWEVWFFAFVLRYKDGDIRVMLVSNFLIDRNTCVKVCDSLWLFWGIKMANHYVMKSEHDLFFDCLPCEWQSGTSDGIFLILPIYPPRSMSISTLIWWLIIFCNKYVSSLWLMLSPWIIHTLTLPPLLASLVPRNFHRCIKPTIYLPQNSHHT